MSLKQFSSTVGQATPQQALSAFVMESDADFTEHFFCADKVAPLIQVENRRGIYLRARLGKGELMNGYLSARSQGGDYQRVNRQFDVDNYVCEEYGLEAIVDDSYSSEVSRFVDVDAFESMILRRQVLLSYEARVAAMIQDSNVFTATNSIVAYTEANLATINFPADVAAAKVRLEAKGCFPNTIVIPVQVYERIRRSPLMQNQIFGIVPRGAGQQALPDEAQVAAALGMENVIVARCPKNLAAKGQTFSGGFVWNNTYVALLKVQEGWYTQGGTARTIGWSEDASGLCTVEAYREDKIRSTIVRARQNVAEKVIDPTSCELITTQYTT